MRRRGIVELDRSGQGGRISGQQNFKLDGERNARVLKDEQSFGLAPTEDKQKREEDPFSVSDRLRLVGVVD